MSSTATVPAPQPSTEDKVSAAVQVGGAIVSQFVPAPVGAVIAEGVQLEPEIYHLISALIHMFKKK
jgi:hypothetical protein